MVPALELRGMTRTFGGSWSNRDAVHAVRGVDVTLQPGQIVALVGQSGSGKTTLGRMAALLEPSTAGSIRIAGQDATRLRGAPLRAARRNLQMVFQDPFDSIDSRQTVFQVVEGCLLQTGVAARARRKRAVDALESVGLDTSEGWLGRYPHQLSGGQRQRLAIARALVLEPAVLVADEPVSMLDVSVRAGILRLFDRIRTERGTACLFITHDLAVARYVSDEIHVMFEGEVVERGDTEQLIANPQHEYTKLLLSSAPELERVAVPSFGPVQHSPNEGV